MNDCGFAQLDSKNSHYTYSKYFLESNKIQAKNERGFQFK